MIKFLKIILSDLNFFTNEHLVDQTEKYYLEFIVKMLTNHDLFNLLKVNIMGFFDSNYVNILLRRNSPGYL